MGDPKLTAEERATELGERLGLGELDGAERAWIVVALETHATDTVAEVRTRAEKAEAAVRAGDALLASWEHEVVQLRRQVDAWEQQSYAAHKRAEKAEARVDELEAEVAPLRLAVQRVQAEAFGRDGKSPVLAVGYDHTTRSWADGMNEAMERVRDALAPTAKEGA